MLSRRVGSVMDVAGLAPSNEDRDVAGAHPGKTASEDVLDSEYTTSEELAFRRAYRRFREGHWCGARGEVADVVTEKYENDATCQMGEWEEVLGIDGFKDPDDEWEASFLAVRDFRLSYRRHRMGDAQGAKGEIQSLAMEMSMTSFRLLPVIQLAQFRKQLASWNDAVSRGDVEQLVGLHLHVGAGKIGLGLALPAFSMSGRRFCLLQRPSEFWEPALRAGRCAVRVNGDTVAELRVVSTLREIEETDGSDSAKENLLALTDDPAVICALTVRAASLSCAVGGNDLKVPLAPLINALNKVHDHAQKESVVGPALVVPLYACENNHDAVEALTDALAGKADVIAVLVDRVCTTRDMRNDGSVDVGTEPWPGLMVFPPAPLSAGPRPRLPFGGSTVREPHTEDGATFLHRKKILTVNGTHTTIAFLTLAHHEPDTLGPPNGSYELLAFDIDDPQDVIGRQVWIWAVARQVMLMYEFDEAVVKHTMLGTTVGDPQAVAKALLDEARANVTRLSTGGDQTSRVLGGGVENRWRTRLVNVNDFLQGNSRLGFLSKTLLKAAGVSDEEMRRCVLSLVARTKRFVKPPRADRSCSPVRWMSPARANSRSHSRKRRSTSRKRLGANGDIGDGTSKAAVLFDFDGTVGDTETPAMEVAFWELAPYLPCLVNATKPELEAACAVFVRENAGKAFEHMIEACDTARSSAGLVGCEEARSSRQEPATLLSLVDDVRKSLGLGCIVAMRDGIGPKECESLLQQQKDDTVTRLAKVTRPTPGVTDALDSLKDLQVPFVIATTSGKPRVPVCVDAAELRRYFPSDEEHIHSGESDFTPPKFKPDPAVYLRAAASVAREPASCVAVEDSASGVGSAANAGIGLIVGYVGASHIGPEKKSSHATMLMAGAKSDNGRGADIVISHMHDLPPLVEYFAIQLPACTRSDGKHTDIPAGAIANPVGQIFFQQRG